MVDSSGIGSFSASFQTPTRFIQPPRLVELATSGLTVATRSATSGSSRSVAVSISPNACWEDMFPLYRCPKSGGIRISGGLKRGRLPTPSRRPVSMHSRPAGAVGSMRSHSSPSGTFSSRRSRSISRSFRMREWFCGSPMDGSRQPLSV